MRKHTDEMFQRRYGEDDEIGHEYASGRYFRLLPSEAMENQPKFHWQWRVGRIGTMDVP